MMSQLDFAQAKAQKETGKIQVIDAPSPAYQVFIMRVDRAAVRRSRRCGRRCG